MKIFHQLSLALATLALISCGTISTDDLRNVSTPFPDAAPARLLVRDFDSSSAVLRRDAREGDLMARLTRGISADLAREFKAAGREAQILAGQPADGPGWVVTGRLRLVQWSDLSDSPGDPSASGDRIECTAYVYDAGKSRTQPFLSFTVNVRRATDLAAACDEVARKVARQTLDYIGQNF